MNYNIIERMKKANEKHKIQIDENHQYSINSSVPAVLKLEEIAKHKGKKEDDNVINDIYDMIGVTLGKEALDYIKSQEYTMSALVLITEAISAAVNDMTLEEMQEKQKSNTPSK